MSTEWEREEFARDAGFEAGRRAGLREAARMAREWTFGTAPSNTHLSVARVNFARFADRIDALTTTNEPTRVPTATP